MVVGVVVVVAVVLVVVVLLVVAVVVVVPTFMVKNHKRTPAGKELPKMSITPLAREIISTIALLALAALTPEAATLDQLEIVMIKILESDDQVIPVTIGVPAVWSGPKVR